MKNGAQTKETHFMTVYKEKKSGVALTQLSLTLHYSRRIFYHQFYIHVKSFFLCFIVDELPAFIVIVYIFLT